EQAGPVPLEVDCDSGAHVKIKIEAAHPRWGLGFYYELRTESIGSSKVLGESPAARAGIMAGDEVLEIQGKRVKGMDSGEAQSRVNANAQIGVELLLRGTNGAERKVTVKEGPVYPSVEDGIPVD